MEASKLAEFKDDIRQHLYVQHAVCLLRSTLHPSSPIVAWGHPCGLTSTVVPRWTSSVSPGELIKHAGSQLLLRPTASGPEALVQLSVFWQAFQGCWLPVRLESHLDGIPNLWLPAGLGLGETLARGPRHEEEWVKGNFSLSVPLVIVKGWFIRAPKVIRTPHVDTRAMWLTPWSSNYPFRWPYRSRDNNSLLPMK